MEIICPFRKLTTREGNEYEEEFCLCNQDNCEFFRSNEIKVLTQEPYQTTTEIGTTITWDCENPLGRHRKWTKTSYKKVEDGRYREREKQ